MDNVQTAYKNVYVIDMAQISKNRAAWAVLGTALPIVTKNGVSTSDNHLKLSERCVRKMISQYDILSNALGATDASTIIEYLDKAGKPVVTLYPTNDIDVHNTDWTNVPSAAIEDLHKIHDMRIALLKKFKDSANNK